MEALRSRALDAHRSVASRGIRHHERQREAAARRHQPGREAVPRHLGRIRQDARRLQRLGGQHRRAGRQFRRELGAQRHAARLAPRLERAVERGRHPVSTPDALTERIAIMVQQLIGTAGAPIDATALSDEVARRLRREIFSGRYEGGETLKQLHVAERFGVSAVPVREAFQRLVAEGFLIPHRNRGVVVARLGKADIVDIAELRVLLEPHAMRLSAPQLTPADLADAATILKAADKTRDGVDRSERHWAFHRLLYSRADRPRLLETIDKLYLSINRYLLHA